VRDLRNELEFRGTTLARSGLAIADLAALVAALEEKRITPQVATRLLRAKEPLGPLLATELGESRPQDDAVAAAARAVVAEETRAVADYRAGKTATLNFLVGKAMRDRIVVMPTSVVRAAVEAALREG